MPQRRIVILGGGFGGAYCAKTLERELRREDVGIVLVDRKNYLTFYPLLVEAGTGSLQPRHVTVPIRSFLRHTRFRMGEVEGVDLQRRQVTVRPVMQSDVLRLDYDDLVLALGSVTSLPDSVPGLRRHAFEMKDLVDAVALRDRCVALLEAAATTEDRARRKALMRLVVVGGNFTGAEVAGEFDAYLRRAAQRYPVLDPGDCRVTLVEIGDRILRFLDEELSEFARRHLERRRIDLRLNTTVSEIHADHVRLKDGTVIATHTVIWCAGIAPNPLGERLDLPRDERGYVLCEPDLRVESTPHVWALGDLAVNIDPRGHAYPATAQHAVRQGRHLARNLARSLRGKPTRPLEIRTLGSLAALGCRTGVARVFGIKLAGFPAWWMYRSVYLLKMPGFARKLRVALDWTLDLLLPPDYSRLEAHGTAARSGRRGPDATGA